MDFAKLAQLLFKNETLYSREDLEALYPPRSVSPVTRFAPSPTGFLHIGGVYASLFSELFAHCHGGIFMLRVEDTDQKREQEGAVQLIIDGLKYFQIQCDEGPIGPNESDIGNYGPYTQSQREKIYKSCAKILVEKRLAYPCFLTEEEIAEIRACQAAANDLPGIYGDYSPWRGAKMEEIEKALSEGKKFALRFRAPFDMGKRVKLVDEVRGEMEMQDNFLDHVVLKSGGLPTYHFAHVVDDHFMRTTHVVRGDEWLPSFPLHVQMFKAMEFELPKFIHLAPICKMDGASRRKLSKRKDPEASVEFFFSEGYPPMAVADYLLNIMDSRYEDWRKANPNLTCRDYTIDPQHLGSAGALFDIEKLNSISNFYLTQLSTEELYALGLEWAQKYNTPLFERLQKHSQLAKNALNIERHTEKDPRRFTVLGDIEKQLSFFFDETYEELYANRPAFPESMDEATLKALVADYIDSYDNTLDKEAWFADLKELGARHGFARDNAEFKAGGCKGKVGDVAMSLRILLLGSSQTPDLHAAMQVLGVDTIKKRLGRIL